MTLVQLKASRAIWRRREQFRYRKWRWYKDRSKRADRDALRSKWFKLYQEARAERIHRDRQIKAALPLRERAWAEMQKLIDAQVTERGGNNRGPAVERIIREAGGVPGEAWCGDTVMVCYLRAGAKTVQRAWASVSWLNRLLAAVPRSLVRRGHVVTYKFDHTGLFKRWATEIRPGYFWAGEGNTGDSGAQSDSKTGGDGVKLKLRHVDQVAAFRRVTK